MSAEMVGRENLGVYQSRNFSPSGERNYTLACNLLEN
jgi:hypothetical protein